MKPQVAFLHVGKTGGTTVRVAMSLALPGRVFFHGFDAVGDRESPLIWDIPMAERGKFDAVAGHFHLGVRDFLPRPVEYISLFRHPYDRLRSVYYHALREPRWPEPTRSAALASDGLEDFMYRVASGGLPPEVNPQAMQLVGPERAAEALSRDKARRDALTAELLKEISAFSVLGITDSVDDFMDRVWSRYGWPEVPRKRYQVGYNRRREDRVSRELIGLITNQSWIDYTLYTRAAELSHV